MKYLGLVILLIFPVLSRSQDVQFTAEAVPAVLRVGEQFNLVLTSNEEFSELSLPEIPDARFLGGPSTGHSTSVSSVNGKITSVSTYQYTYFFRAEKEGKFTIPATTAKIKGKIYRSNTVNIEVLQASAASSSQGTGRNTGKGAGSNTTPGENDLFVRIIPDKTDAYIGEQIMATFKIYTRQPNLAGIDPNFKGPDFTGFFTEIVETPQPRSLQREAVNGDIFYTAVIRRMMVIPQKSGQLSIDPFDLDVAVRREVRRRISDDPFFDDFVIPDVQDIPVKLTSRPVNINVKPLPPNAPASFKGAVGNFRLNASLSSNSTNTNEPLTLKVAVTGKGNLKLINEVAVNVPYDIEKFDPVINTKFDNPLSGTKTFEYLIMPRVQGNFTLPPVEFTYFDTEAGQYKTLKSGPYDITVAKGEGDSLMVMIPGSNKEDVLLLNSDIRFIETRLPNLRPVNRFIASSPWYYLMYIVALALFAAAMALRKRIVRQNADIAGMRFRRADKYARKRFKKSEMLLRQGNDGAFYEEMLGAIWGYLSYKLGIPVSSLSKETARSALSERGLDAELIDRLFSITETCEMARYGFGGAETTNPQQLYHDAVKVITSLQHFLSMKSMKSLSSLKSLLSLFFALAALTSFASTPDSLFQKGNDYYMQRQYNMAEKNYSAILEMGYESADLYFNLGNALYKQEKLAPAILCYEKALLLKPGDEDIKENLVIANSRIIDKIDAIPEFFIKRWINGLKGLFSPDVWAVISIALFVAGLAGILVSYFSLGAGLRKAALSTGVVFIFLSLVSVSLMATRIRTIMKHEHAIIMSSTVTARSSPDEQSTNVFVLHEGTKVRITDSIENWKEIRIANGNTGWIPGETLAEI